MITKDELATQFDPAVKKVEVINQGCGYDKLISLTLAFNTSVVTFKQRELERLLEEINEE
jgi:hypothetical protein